MVPRTSMRSDHVRRAPRQEKKVRENRRRSCLPGVSSPFLLNIVNRAHHRMKFSSCASYFNRQHLPAPDRQGRMRGQLEGEKMYKETVSTDKAPKAIGPYEQAIKVGDFVYTAGQIPIDRKSVV